MKFPVFRRPVIRSPGVAASVAYGIVAGVVIALLVFPLESLTGRQGDVSDDSTLRSTQDQMVASQAVPSQKPQALQPPTAMSRLPAVQQPAAVQPLPAIRFADFGDEPVSPDARHVAHWVADTRDNDEHGFVIVDKKSARVYVFDAQARLQAASPVLLGAALGDESVPGIGTRPLSDISVEERTTPAGRFLAQQGLNTKGEDVVWVDYDAAVSMHRVRATVPAERRLARLASETVDDNRISWGCINVPVAFYEQWVQPVFAQRKAVVYVLPEIKPVEQVFGSYDVTTRRRQSAPSG